MYLLRGIISIPAPGSSVEGILLRGSCIFFADGAENRAKSLGFARSGALGLPGAGHGLAGGVLWGLEINFQRAAGCSLAPRARSSAPMAFAAGVFCIP